MQWPVRVPLVDMCKALDRNNGKIPKVTCPFFLFFSLPSPGSNSPRVNSRVFYCFKVVACFWGISRNIKRTRLVVSKKSFGSEVLMRIFRGMQKVAREDQREVSCCKKSFSKGIGVTAPKARKRDKLKVFL
ncbi:hypothetical protein KY290_029144 [Solanum tuberosum]|uniref:Uncharacterized protein n=1 Tax=Solanum tuberosum TaxID=4113 RepID=A0ABQ7UJX3_SOLTU|nr:hypothetical protein KY290_029144 [Solanum tuberosum]